MTFQSVLYLLFLAAVWLVSLPLRRAGSKQILLLAASYLFYASWIPAFTVLLFATSATNYVLGRWIARQPRRAVLWLGLSVNILFLSLFKYANWLLGLFGVVDSPLASVIAPLGVSFYTFQAMSYLIDRYRGEQIDLSFREFLLYMAFWPIVLAGPVCRVGEMVPQFRALPTPATSDLAVGVQRIIYGLFMKVVLADMLGFGISASEGVTTGFDTVSGGWSGMDVWFLAVGFGFQLFFDFAGYSHLAIGSARLFGIRVRENFDHPYLSQSPTEFWTRWHMSLSTWIRDYVFFPLAAAKRALWWRNLSLLAAMTIFGIWHGSGATFLFWGVYQGLLLMIHRGIQRVSRPALERWGELARVIWTGAAWAGTFASITLGWVLFRSNDLHQAGVMLRAVLTPHGYFHPTLRLNFYLLVLIVVSGYFTWVLTRAAYRRVEGSPHISRLVWLTRPLLYSTLLTLIIIWSRQAATFVYMQY